MLQVGNVLEFSLTTEQWNKLEKAGRLEKMRLVDRIERVFGKAGVFVSYLSAKQLVRVVERCGGSAYIEIAGESFNGKMKLKIF